MPEGTCACTQRSAKKATENAWTRCLADTEVLHSVALISDIFSALASDEDVPTTDCTVGPGERQSKWLRTLREARRPRCQF